ncbi:LysE family translocator [Sphaerisporangium fuscum]|uniref:LysE family translocator n=1 Tax=Sphaerisporangium fuscum TaxID=2835868 RepID=UPI001BDD56C4|nr:LysE family translocator [Sphaerisporangium fuscum]
MTREALLAYLGIVAMITITPGPDTALVVRNAMRQGWGAGVRTGLGSAAGLLLWGLAACAGIAALLAASMVAFTVLKLAGAAYLGYMGVRMLWRAWRSSAPATAGPRPADAAPATTSVSAAGTNAASPGAHASSRALFRQGLSTNLLNPKAAAFFTALLPQFVTAHDGTATLLIIGLTLIAAASNLTGQFVFAITADRTARLVDHRHFERVMDTLVGSVLIALGLKLATGDRP